MATKWYEHHEVDASVCCTSAKQDNADLVCHFQELPPLSSMTTANTNTSIGLLRQESRRNPVVLITEPGGAHIPKLNMSSLHELVCIWWSVTT